MKNSIFKLKINFKKSKNSFIYDDNSNTKFLDFFGQYSTLTLGYNSNAYKNNVYTKKLLEIYPQKIVNCELDSNILQEFKKKFKAQLGLNYYKNFHFCCTGALAVEAAIKTAITASKNKKAKILVFKGSFHGINGYGGIYSDRFGMIKYRLKNFPGEYTEHFDLFEKNKKNLIDKAIYQLERLIKNKKYNGLLIEPIQSTFGDRYIPKEILIEMSLLCKKYSIPLIFDEIQTGFYASGKKWYFQNIGIKPDIVIFGKKAQVSGIMVNNKYSSIFNHELRLNVTWNSDLIDMLRSIQIMNYIDKNNLTNTIQIQSKELFSFLNKFSFLNNVRYCGYIFAFDLKNTNQRDLFFKVLLKNGILTNPTGVKTIRMRPNLDLKKEEISIFKKKFKVAANEF